MRAGLDRLAGLADRQPAGAAFVAWAVIYVGLRVWARSDEQPVLIARAEPDRRDELHTMFGSSTASMLAVTLTVWPFCTRSPTGRRSVRRARAPRGQPLQGLLLSVALLCLISLVTAHLGLAVDHGKRGTEWLEFILIASAAVATLSLLIAGLGFAAVLYLASQPQDPSKGRGALAGQAD